MKAWMYLSGAFFTALLCNILDLDQEITTLLVEMEEVIKTVLLASCHLTGLRYYEGMLPLSLTSTAISITIVNIVRALVIIINVRYLPLALPPPLSPSLSSRHHFPRPTSSASHHFLLLLHRLFGQPCQPCHAR